jgi:hypothetical protein
MQIFYTNIKTNNVTQSERKEMQNAIVDYGALHHTPVQDPTAPPEASQVSHHLVIHVKN